MSRRSWAQPWDLSRSRMRHATTCTAGIWLHIVVLRHRQWLGSVDDLSLIWVLQVGQVMMLFSSRLLAWGPTW